MSKPFRPAHWARVTSSISQKYGIPFQTAKAIYDGLKVREERTPSLSLVKSLPPKPSAWVRRVIDPEKAIQQAVRAAERRKVAYEAAQLEEARKRDRARLKREELLSKPPRPISPPPPLLAPAPAVAPPPKPAPLRANQKGRNRFERTLAAYEVPVSVARSTAGKLIAKEWKDPKFQDKLGNAIRRGYRQVEKQGFMSKKAKARVYDLLENRFGVDKARGMWHSILRACYAKGGKKK